MVRPTVAVLLVAIALTASSGDIDVGVAGFSRPSSGLAAAPANITVIRRAVAAPSGDTRPVWAGFEASLADPPTLVALVLSSVDVYESPGDAVPMFTMPSQTILGTATVLTLVDQPSDGWAEVMLPVRPNGTTGWVAIEDIYLYVVEGRIVVDLSDRTLTYSLNGQDVLTTTIAVGRSAYPTPIGDFFVTDSVTLTRPDGPWGPHALGLSARSETITEYNGGDGIIGIHGTNNPSSIGTEASLGCVRLPNELISRLHAMVPIGTPVEIRA